MQNGNMLRYASRKLQNNKKVVLEAVKSKGCALGYATKGIQNNKEVIPTITAVTITATCLIRNFFILSNSLKQYRFNINNPISALPFFENILS